jgi:hypothetical protein
MPLLLVCLSALKSLTALGHANATANVPVTSAFDPKRTSRVDLSNHSGIPALRDGADMRAHLAKRALACQLQSGRLGRWLKIRMRFSLLALSVLSFLFSLLFAITASGGKWLRIKCFLRQSLFSTLSFARRDRLRIERICTFGSSHIRLALDDRLCSVN